MKRLGVFLIVSVLMFVNLNVFAVEPEIEYNTNLSGDIKLSFNDEWSLGCMFRTQHMHMPPDKNYVEIFADVKIEGTTDAESLNFYCPNDMNNSVEIKIDENGNFNQIINVILTNCFTTDTSNLLLNAFVSGKKGDETISVKIGKGKLDTDFPINMKNQDINNDGSVDATDLALYRRANLPKLINDFDNMPQQESIDTYIYNDWFLKSIEKNERSYSVNALSHLRVISNCNNIMLRIGNKYNDNTRKIEYCANDLDVINECYGSIPRDIGHTDSIADISATVSIGNREVILNSSLTNREIPEYVIGDINGDMKINATDYHLLRRYILNNNTKLSTEFGFYCADLNDDNKINTTDCVLLKRYIMALIEEFPKQKL